MLYSICVSTSLEQNRALQLGVSGDALETGTAAYVVQAGGDGDEKCRESKGRYREKK